MNLWMYLKEHMLSRPSQKVGEEGAFMTYEELVVYAEILAQRLSGEALCAICCRSEMANAMALLGCFAAGTTAVPLSARYGSAHVKKILQACRPSCLISDIDGALRIYRVDGCNAPTYESMPALIMWTSGTTGVPKGAMLEENAIVSNVEDICKYFKADDSDTILISRPLYHCAVLTGEFLTALVKGAKIIFCSEKFNPALLARLIRENDVTVFGGTPTLLSLLLRFARESSRLPLKHVVVSGECMSRDVGIRLREGLPDSKIYHVYGLTEAGPRVSYMPPEDFDKAPDRVGVPLASVKLEIRDASGKALSKNQRGMLWVKGPSLMSGYYNAPELSREKLRSGWLCTGDIAEIDSSGWLKIVGRSDDLIIRAGLNIYPQELEAALKEDSRTKDALIYPYKDKNGTTQIGLKITGSFNSRDEVRKMCIERLPAAHIPAKIEIVSSLDKNASGKIIRRNENA